MDIFGYYTENRCSSAAAELAKYGQSGENSSDPFQLNQSKCVSAPRPTVGLPKVPVAGLHLASVLQEGRKSANIHSQIGSHPGKPGLAVLLYQSERRSLNLSQSEGAQVGFADSFPQYARHSLMERLQGA